MKKPHEAWTTKQTHQGTWVMEDNGHAFGPESKAIAMVYLPEASEVAGESLAQRIANAEALALSRAKKMAAANEMVVALAAAVRRVVEGHQPILGPGVTPDEIAARGLPVSIRAEDFAAMVAALRKAGVLP